VEAVHLIADGKAPRIPQPKEGATYEGIQKKENAEVVLNNAVVCMSLEKFTDYNSSDMKLTGFLAQLFPCLLFLGYLHPGNSKDACNGAPGQVPIPFQELHIFRDLMSSLESSTHS